MLTQISPKNRNLIITLTLLTELLALAVLPVAAAFATGPAYGNRFIPVANPDTASDDFVITVKTDNPGVSTSTQFTIPTISGGYNYNVDCDNNGTLEAISRTGNYTCTYPSAGTYTIRIKDNSGAGTGFPRIYFNNAGDKAKLLTIQQWGTGKWASMANAFYGCSNLTIPATGAPDLSNVTDMSAMFRSASAFNGDIGSWNTSSVTNMNGMFYMATAFNQDIGGWDVSSLSDATNMFFGAGLSSPNYDLLLIGWNSQALMSGGALHGGNSTYCAGEAARYNMINSKGWTIIDGGKASSCYILDLPVVLR
jgi:surface protein